MRRRFLIDSDHHAGAGYSNIRQMIGQFAERLSDLNADMTVDERICVFNGDMFEIEEGALSRKQMIVRAEQMMRAYLEAFPNVHFVYVLGNHEDFQAYHQVLQVLAEEYPERLLYTPDYTQIDDLLFTHGDLQVVSRGVVADKELHGGVVRREDGRFGAGYRGLDDGESAMSYAIKGKLKGIISPLVAHNLFPFKRSVRDVLRAFRAGDNEYFKNQGIRKVFMGHIHPETPKLGFWPEEGADLEFYVTGAAVRSSPHVMCDLITENGRTLDETIQAYRMKPKLEPENPAVSDAMILNLVQAYRDRFFCQESVSLVT
jgi:hypothetical protein